MKTVAKMTPAEKQAEWEANWTGALQLVGSGTELTLIAVLPGGVPVYVNGDPQAKAEAAFGLALRLEPDLLDMEFDDDWAWLRLDNEPGYDESLHPYNY